MHTYTYMHTYIRTYCTYIHLYVHNYYSRSVYISVPTPIVNVTAMVTQTVGQALILKCQATIVSSITSRVDIVWNSNSKVLRRINSITPIILNSSLLYRDSYTISQLSTTDDGRVIQCEVVINTSPPVMATDSITLDVIGM